MASLLCVKQIGTARKSASDFSRLILFRNLGNRARGPAPSEILDHFKCAKNLYEAPAVTYDGFKQQCESFRMFAFFLVTGILSLDLLIRPPRSSYWRQWNPVRLPKHIWKGLIA